VQTMIVSCRRSRLAERTAIAADAFSPRAAGLPAFTSCSESPFGLAVPDGVDQFILADDSASVLDQIGEQAEDLRFPRSPDLARP